MRIFVKYNEDFVVLEALKIYMKKNLSILFFLILIFKIGYSQQQDSSIVQLSNGVSKPSVLSTHPLGILFSRIQGNFRYRPTSKAQLAINIESGNVWGTPIKSYIPNDKTIREQVKQHEWHQAQYFFNVEELDAKTYEMQIDGVIKGLRLQTSFRLGNEHELNVGARMFALTKGKLPFTLLTGDDFVEKFHKNIAGGVDPFDRGVFGHNDAQIKYTDRNGNALELNTNELVFGGLESTYYYYPRQLLTETFSTNIGAHVGFNFSSYNSSLDFGISSNALKKIAVNDRSFLHIGLGIGVLRKHLINLKSNNLDLGTNNYSGNLESVITYNLISKKNTKHTIGLDYYVQTSLNKKEELDYSILIRHPEAHNSWGHGVTNLYKNNSYWTLFYSFTKKITTAVYLQQDFEVNNNPDFQTGIHMSFYLN